jgi:hypothetical protein
MVFLYRPSGTSVPAPVDPYIACQHMWEAWDGSEWDLSHGSSGLALQSGTRGMEMPDPTFYKTRAAGVDGSLYRGHIIDEQSDFWPLKMFSDGGSAEWVQHYRAFWRTLQPDKTGLWWVVQPDGTKRSKRVRFAGLNDRSTDIDPMLTGWNLYGINLAAEQPFWMGAQVTRSFEGGTPTSPSGSYIIWIKSSFTLSSASITNDGDKDAWPVWTVRGPCTTVTVGLAGHAITFPMTLTSGQWVTIDTDPSDQTAYDQTGADRSAELTAVDFAEIPPGVNVPLTVSMSGTGGVDVSITPRYYLAVG